MRQQLNKHHSYHEHIYETLKNQTALQTPDNQNYCGHLQSNLVHHYQNQLIRNAIDERRLQFRNFVASVSQQQIIDRERDQEKANLLLLGNLDQLQRQKARLYHQRARSSIQDQSPIYVSDPKINYKYDHSLDADYIKSQLENFKVKRQPLANLQSKLNSQIANRAQDNTNKQSSFINKRKQRDIILPNYIPKEAEGAFQGIQTNQMCLQNQQLAAKLRKIKSYRLPQSGKGFHEKSVLQNNQNIKEQTHMPLGLKKINNLAVKKEQEYSEMLAETIRKKWMVNQKDNNVDTKAAVEDKKISKNLNDKNDSHFNSLHYRSATEDKNQKNFNKFIKKMSSTQSLKAKSITNDRSSHKKKQAIKIQQNLYLPTKDQSSIPQEQLNFKIKIRSPSKKQKIQHKKNKINLNLRGKVFSNKGHSLNLSPKKFERSPERIDQFSPAKNKRSHIAQLRNKKMPDNYFSNMPDLQSLNPIQFPSKRSIHDNQHNSSKNENKATPNFTKSINTSLNLQKKSRQLQTPDWQKKIKRRLQLSQIIFIDSNYRNQAHQVQHLNNSYIKQEAERKEIRQKICKFVEQQRKNKKKKSNLYY